MTVFQHLHIVQLDSIPKDYSIVFEMALNNHCRFFYENKLFKTNFKKSSYPCLMMILFVFEKEGQSQSFFMIEHELRQI